MRFFTENALAEIPFVLLIAGVVLVGLWISNIVYDSGVQHYISRKIGHSAGGVAFLHHFTFHPPGGRSSSLLVLVCFLWLRVL